MKKYLTRLSLITISCQLLAVSSLYAQVGTWTQLTHTAPDDNMGTLLLLTDGRVICHNDVGGQVGRGWDVLTPDASGSYVNGTWTTIASMHNDRYSFSSQVLPNGKVYAAGGEYGAGGVNGELYDPVANTWTVVGTVPNNWNIYDAPSELLYNGNIIEGTEVGPSGGQPCNTIEMWSPTGLSYTTEANEPENHDEAAWLKLPDSTVLTIGMPYPNFPATDSSCRYVPQTNTWLIDNMTPNNVYDQYGFEAGGAYLLPNGKAIFFGATQYNDIYTPSGNHTTPGTWAAAANFPQIQGTYVAQPDAPGAMMVNGHILLAVSPIGTGPGNNEFLAPTWFLEYDYTSNTFTKVTSPIPGFGGDSLPELICQETTFLDLPDGNVLMGISQTSYSTSYFIYTPGSGPIAQGKPTINSILPDGCPNYLITGKLFNGISEGTGYGDDVQNSTNYPLVRLTNGTNVYYAKTSNWNRVGAVMTDSLEDTAEFTPPAGLPAGTYSLVVVVNGFASNPTLFTVFGLSSISHTNISTCGAIGSASISASGGLSPYTYLWSAGGATSGTASNLSAGAYTITVEDNNQCTATASVTITQAGSFSLSVNVTSNSNCPGANNGSASSSVSGGTSPYTYNWTSGAGTNANASGLSAGTYTLYVRDACNYSESATATITQPVSNLGISISSHANVNCFGNSTGSATANTASGGASPYTYTWTPSGGNSLTASTLTAGTYTITVTDNNGCTATNSVTITEPGILTASANTTSNISCNGGNNGSASASASGGTSPYTYLWSDGSSQTAVNAVSLSAGTFTVTLTDSKGCLATASVAITQPGIFTASANTTSNVSCNGETNGSASLAVSGGTSPYTYLWNDANSQTTINAAGLMAGTYTVTVTDNNGCQGISSVTITQPIALSMVADSIDATTGNCNGSAWVIVSGGTVPYSYLWTGGLTTDTISSQCVGSYCSTVTDANGCMDSICVAVDLSTGTNQLTIENGQWTIYPNPNNGIFTVSFSHAELVSASQSNIEIYNILGEKVLTETLRSAQGDNLIDLKEQPNGVYFYRVLKQDGNLLGEGKIVIEK